MRAGRSSGPACRASTATRCFAPCCAMDAGRTTTGFSRPSLPISPAPSRPTSRTRRFPRPRSSTGQVAVVLGPDETLQGSAAEVFRRFLDDTAAFWRAWVRNLGIPFEWQENIIRAAITLKLNAYEDTGAIVAAVSTSIPESRASGRNWDYRYCWLRDAYFVVNALNRMNATRPMERYLDYIINIATSTNGRDLQPVYAISGKAGNEEREIGSLPGYRGMGPVRIGNQAYSQVQHDVYGAVILAAAHVFFDARLALRSDESLFRQLEQLGERAAALFDQPDAGLWELRGTKRVHTFSSVMCWAGCDRLAKIAARIGLADRARAWRERADAMQIGRASCRERV